MEAKHTPGEWNAKDSIVYSLATGQDIARCDIGGKDEQTEANARLIAATPELLEALQKIVIAYSETLMYEYGQEHIDKCEEIHLAKQAIKKATDEG